ncbi:class I SAM-dependent methyltransferase [Gramella jeungdoensis]|uniref:Class I SAM-dependent methyltransferase n=1 Tax=Gramella jeungdoensis TaxID=708091 RepID=A0ABT0Z3D4_9FLAO|nr:class I SAM-dependent methyltransferase [Gramella jeungdoensis]MCM8570232.1 class I SAM-dependent methyltransferase [Gramella jeungdoensis]
MKDNFSSHAEDYSRYRPKYPAEVYDYIIARLSGHEKAWDCGTGNGQVAAEIYAFFKKVEATDISTNQIKNAVKRENIHYSVQPAEKTDFPDNDFDLIITAQAIHWFNFNKFYNEVKRCLKPDGLFAVLGYGLFSGNPETNKIIGHFYNNVIGSYWDPERKYLEDNYFSIPFPFSEIETPMFYQEYKWTIDQLLGYLRTWSAVKHYEQANHEDPVSLIEKDLRKAFGVKNEVSFPILFRLGKLS